MFNVKEINTGNVFEVFQVFDYTYLNKNQFVFLMYDYNINEWAMSDSKYFEPLTDISKAVTEEKSSFVKGLFSGFKGLSTEVVMERLSESWESIPQCIKENICLSLGSKGNSEKLMVVLDEFSKQNKLHIEKEKERKRLEDLLKSEQDEYSRQISILQEEFTNTEKLINEKLKGL